MFNLNAPLQVNNSRHEMVRKDLGDNIMEVSHTNGTDRWLVIKKQLDASNVRHFTYRCFPMFVFGCLLFKHSTACTFP